MKVLLVRSGQELEVAKTLLASMSLSKLGEGISAFEEARSLKDTLVADGHRHREMIADLEERHREMIADLKQQHKERGDALISSAESADARSKELKEKSDRIKEAEALLD